MARGQDLLFAHHGSSNEDNATKNLCWLINHLPWNVSVEIIRAFVGVFDQESLLSKLGPEDVDVVAQESAEVTKSRNGRKVLLGLGPNYHSYSDTDINEFTPECDKTTSESKPDLVIHLADELVIAIEAKDSEFDPTQLQNHARWLGADRFETITWKSVAEKFDSLKSFRSDNGNTIEATNGSPLLLNSIELLLSEYEKILRDQLIPRSRIIASSEYTGGKNYVKARKNVGSNSLTGRVGDDLKESLPVQVAIYFRAKGKNTDGQRLFFSREEWVSLLKSIRKPAYHIGMAAGDISSIVADYDPSNDDDITIAHIEDSNGNEKTIFYGTGKGARTKDLLYMNQSTSAGGNLQKPPMFDPDEFNELFADINQMRRLFTNPEAVFDELEKDL